MNAIIILFLMGLLFLWLWDCSNKLMRRKDSALRLDYANNKKRARKKSMARFVSIK